MPTARQKKLYTLLKDHPPTTRHDGIGQAYYHGLDNPDAPPGVRAGDRTSQAYAAWTAGQHRALGKCSKTWTQS